MDVRRRRGRARLFRLSCGVGCTAYCNCSVRGPEHDLGLDYLEAERAEDSTIRVDSQQFAGQAEVTINIVDHAGVSKVEAPKDGAKGTAAAPPKPKPPQTIAEYFESKKPDFTFKAMHSFHTLHIREDHREILLEVKKPRLRLLFFHHLTFQGAEGMLPDMWDATPRNAGLHFDWAPNGRDVLLVEAQQKLGKVDFAAPMYDTITGGLQRGYVQLFKPLVNEEGQDASVLLDLSAWLLSFAKYTQFGKKRSVAGDLETLLVGYSTFPQNFLLRLSAQPTGGLPLKEQQDAARKTQYWTAGFCMLPEEPMIPRPFDRRVGYFTTPVLVGGKTAATAPEHVIHRWDLKRRGGRLLFCIDPSVPTAYHDTLKRGVESWNVAFEAAGFNDAPVIQCVAPGDHDWPKDFGRGDSRFIAIHMTDSAVPVLGYGPSVVDFRSGEILAASVLLGFSPFLEQASQYSLEVLDPLRERLGCGSRLPLVDADHPDVLRTLLKTVIHEVGHTLGLRHNFIAAEDGNSSVMEYVDPLDTSDPSSPQYGGHFLDSVGNYDIYAIKYGYTRLEEQWGARHPSLLLLANGQDTNEELAAVPRNPLFATDEDAGGMDPRVHRWAAGVRRFGRDKMQFAAKRRQELLERVEKGDIYPETYSQRLSELMMTSYQHVTFALSFVAGAEVDARRVVAEPCSAADIRDVLRTVVDFVVGPTFRLSAAESRHFLRRRSAGAVYSLAQGDVLGNHKRCSRQLLRSLLSAQRLERLELRRLQMRAADTDQQLGTFELLTALALHPGHSTDPLLDPFAADGSCNKDRLDERGSDPLRAEVRLALAESVAGLQERGTHAAVRTGAEAFASLVRQMVKPAIKGMRVDAAASWRMLTKEIKPKRGADSGPGMFLRIFGEDPESVGEEFAMWQRQRRARL